MIVVSKLVMMPMRPEHLGSHPNPFQILREWPKDPRHKRPVIQNAIACRDDVNHRLVVVAVAVVVVVIGVSIERESWPCQRMLPIPKGWPRKRVSFATRKWMDKG